MDHMTSNYSAAIHLESIIGSEPAKVDDENAGHSSPDPSNDHPKRKLRHSCCQFYIQSMS